MKRMQSQQKAKPAVAAVDLARVAMATSQQLVADASSSDLSFPASSISLLPFFFSQIPPLVEPSLSSSSPFHASSFHNLHILFVFCFFFSCISAFSSIRCKGPKFPNHMGLEGQREKERAWFLFLCCLFFSLLDMYCSRFCHLIRQFFSSFLFMLVLFCMPWLTRCHISSCLYLCLANCI